MDLTYSVTTTYISLQEKFGDWLAGQGCSPSTIKSYLHDLAVYSRWFEKENGQPFSIDLLTSTDLRSFCAYSLEIQLVMPATWNRRREMLKNLTAWAQETGKITHDPLRGVMRAKDDREELAPPSIDEKEFRRLMRQLELDINAANTARRLMLAIRDRAWIGLAAYTGLREGEICNLRLAHVDIGPRHGRVRIYNGKGNKYRDEPLNSEARYLLGHWLPYVSTPGNGERVFPSLSPRGAQKRLADLCRRAEVRHYSPHQLRHTFVDNLFKVRTPLPVVKRLAGHKRTSTTERYSHPRWSDMEAASEAAYAGVA